MDEFGIYLRDSAFPEENFSQEEIEKVFEVIDLDKDRVISKKEMEVFFK